MSDDCFDLAEELDRLRLENKRLRDSERRKLEYLNSVLKEHVAAYDKYGPGLKCDHVTLRRADLPCPECFTGHFLTVTKPAKTVSAWYDMSEYTTVEPAETEKWVRDRFVLDGHPTLVYAWRKA